MSIRIPFNGGSIQLAEAWQGINKKGVPAKYDAAVIVFGASYQPLRLPLDVVEAIIALGKSDQYREFVKNAKQPKN